MASRPIGSAPPPFYWKVPVPEKDYMSENYRRIRQIANQSQKKRNEPMKAAFIPGVTKNEKYAHVPSRVSEFLKTKKEPDNPGSQQNSRRPSQLQRMGSGPNQPQPINRRLSKSSTDLRSSTKPAQTTPNVAANGHYGQGHSNNQSNVPSMMTRRRRISEESYNPNQESVYNWRFRDDVVNQSCGASISNGLPNSIPPKYCHRVEYLPCDGICAEENFVVEGTQPDSARSSSSRTSRGCNTEETRILGDIKSCELDKTFDSAYNESLGVQNQNASMPKSRSVFTLPAQEAQNLGKKPETATGDWYMSKTRQPNNNTGFNLDAKLNSMKVSEGQRPENGRVKQNLSSTSIKSAKHFNNGTGGVGGGGDIPHTLGTVPKYLKQRQEEWRVQEQEKKEAEMNANVPHGYVLLSDEERMEHLRTFKRNYDALINDLNRLPIRIDTIRVREHKVQLEQQLTRLEEAMKTFSRPRVWVKVDG